MQQGLLIGLIYFLLGYYFMKKALLSTLIITLATASLSGCMGQMAATKVVTDANLRVVDNRYGRAGTFILLSPVYGIVSVADLFIFNSIEFWTGTNPISGKGPAVVDLPVGSVIKVNSHLDKSLTTHPELTLNEEPSAIQEEPSAIQEETSAVEKVQVEYVDNETARLNLWYADGSQGVIEGTRDKDMVHFYLDGEAVESISVAELQAMRDKAQV